MKNIIVVLVFIALSSKAQYGDLRRDTAKFKKNEIGINLLPIASLFDNNTGNMSFSRISLNYRRHLSFRTAFRTSIGYIPGSYSGNYGLISHKDTLLEFRGFQNITSPKYLLNIGLEHFHYRNKITHSFGAELILAYSHADEKQTYYSRGINQIGTNAPSIIDSVYSQSRRVYSLGAHVFYNLRVALSESWFLSMTLGPYGALNISDYGLVKNLDVKGSLILFSDFSIGYCF